jgi:hypothetical protein
VDGNGWHGIPSTQGRGGKRTIPERRATYYLGRRPQCAALELGIKPLSIYSQEDCFSGHRVQADARDLLVEFELTVSP